MIKRKCIDEGRVGGAVYQRKMKILNSKFMWFLINKIRVLRIIIIKIVLLGNIKKKNRVHSFIGERI